MGQQGYEDAVSAAVRSAATDLVLTRRVVRSLRSSVAGNVRLPMRQVLSSLAAARAGAAWTYRGADLVHRCDLRLPPARMPDREVVTVHDLAFELFPDEGDVPPYAERALRRTRVVIAPSTFSAEQLRERYGLEDVRAVPNGVDPEFADRRALTVADREALGVTGRYVLHSGGCSQRKNLPALAAAWQTLAALLPDVTLVLAGPPDPRRTSLFASLPRVRLVGRLPRDLQVRAVQQAEAVVVPSLYEGFGLPAAEAMLAGTPVVASDRSSMPEVCGDAALLVAPTPQGLVEGLEAVLTHPPTAVRLRAAGPLRARPLTWERTARTHLQIYRELLASA